MARNSTSISGKQLGEVLSVMEDGRWRTLGDIEALTGAPQASISARLRDLRKPQFGSYVVERRAQYSFGGSRVFEYKLETPVKAKRARKAKTSTKNVGVGGSNIFW